MKGLLKWILTIIVAIVIWIAILIVYFIILSVIVSGQTTNNLGRITSTNALVWDFDTNDAIIGFKVYVSGTNVFNAPTNRWQGATNKSLVGWREVYVTAVGDGEESDPSETVLVYFTGGRPSNPSNIQLYSMTTFIATNNLPQLNLPPLPP